MISQKFDFDPFYKRFRQVHFMQRKSLPSVQWLTWLIGFTEGDGSFLVTNRGDLMFVITQSMYNVTVLHDIIKHLGIGRVIVQSKQLKAARYVVQDQIGLSLIICLFNGNLVLPSRRKGFMNFITGYNNIVAKPRTRAPIRKISAFRLLNRPVMFSLDDCWLVGFSDSEACFHARFRIKNYRFDYSLSQKYAENKPVLEHIQQLFNAGVVRPHSQPNNWSFYTTNLNSCEIIIGYFNKFPLKTKKQSSFEKWQQIYYAIKKGLHLLPEQRKKLVILSKLINPKINRSLLKDFIVFKKTK
jgi:LAGLIDADG endonuclease